MRSSVAAALALAVAIALPAVAAAAGADFTSAEPVRIEGRLEVAAIGGSARLVGDDARSPAVIRGADGSLTIWTRNLSRPVLAPGVLVPEEYATSRRYDLRNATLTFTPNGLGRFDATLVGGAASFFNVTGDVRASGVPRWTASSLSEEVGESEFGGETVAFAWDAGWGFVGSYEIYAPQDTFPEWRAPILTATGSVRTQLAGGDLAWASAGQQNEAVLGRWQRDSPYGAVARAETWSWAVFEGEVDEFVVPVETSWALAAPALVWHVDGEAAWSRATGEGDSRAFADVPVVVSGRFTVSPSSGLAPRYLVEGGRLAIGGFAAEEEAGPTVVVAAGAAAAVGVVAWFFVASYSRTPPGRLLEHPRRRAIYDVVLAHPGVHSREIHRTVGGAWGPFAFHLRRLCRGGYLRTERQGIFVAVFPAGVGAPASPWIPNPVARRVYDALPLGTVRTAAELVEEVGISRQLLAYHLRVLQERGLVRTVAIDGEKWVEKTRQGSS